MLSHQTSSRSCRSHDLPCSEWLCSWT